MRGGVLGGGHLEAFVSAEGELLLGGGKIQRRSADLVRLHAGE